METLLSANKARVYLGQLKGVKKIDAETLTHLVKTQGLKPVPDPYGTDRWCFYASGIDEWIKSKTEGGNVMRGPGRPRKGSR